MIWSGSYQSSRVVRLFYSASAVLLAVTAVIVLLTLIIKSAGRFIKDWRYIADSYIDAQASATGDYGVIRNAVQASKPENFTEELKLLTFGEGTHFGVHHRPGVIYSEIVTQVVTADVLNIEKRHLPYPPQQLWCVCLEYEEKQDVVIFLGYHKDMYSAEWIVHIGEQAPFSADIIDLVGQLDCEFSLVPE